MASFEFAMKDFLAQTLNTTHIYDDDVQTWSWLKLDVATVLSTREGLAGLGAVLIHPLQGWQTPETMNSRYKDVFQRQPIADSEVQTLRDLWIIRHSIAHNGGIVTAPDARRLREASLAERQVLIDVDHLEQAVSFLRCIVERLETVVGGALLQRWFDEGSAGTWNADADAYKPLKALTTYIRSRPQELQDADEAMYSADRTRYVQS